MTEPITDRSRRTFVARLKAWQLITGCLGILILPAIAGYLLTKVADAVLLTLPETLSVPTWGMIAGAITITFIVLLVCGSFWYSWIEVEDELDAVTNDRDSLIEVTTQLAKIDVSLLTTLAALPYALDLEQGFKSILYDFLRDAAGIFPKKIHRASILLPNPRNQGYIIPWQAFEMSSESRERTTLSVGDNEALESRGVAGATFRDGNIRIARFPDADGTSTPEIWIVRYSNDDRKWKFEQDRVTQYKRFDLQRQRLPYQSFVTVPTGTEANQVIGVLCFDSNDPTAFNDESLFTFLESLGTKIGSAVLIYRSFLRLSSGISEEKGQT